MTYASSTVPKIHWNPKARNAFEKRKAMTTRTVLNQSSFRQGVPEIDLHSLAQLEKEKRAKMLRTLLFLGSALLVCILVFSFFINQKYFSYKTYDVRAATIAYFHGSENFKKDRKNMPFLEKGYLAWSKDDYEMATFWFERVEGEGEGRYRKESALLILNKHLCEKEATACEAYEAYKTIMEQRYFDWYPTRDYEYLLAEMIVYNRKMFQSFRYDLPPNSALSYAE